MSTTKIFFFHIGSHVCCWAMCAASAHYLGNFEDANSRVGLQTAVKALCMGIPATVAFSVQRWQSKTDTLASLGWRKPTWQGFSKNIWVWLGCSVGGLLLAAGTTFLSAMVIPGVKFVGWTVEGMSQSNVIDMVARQGGNVSEFVNGLSSAPINPVLLGVILTPLAACTVNGLFALGEELGWRGLVQTESKKAGYSFWTSALLTGVSWGLWHAPMIYYFKHNYSDASFLEGTLAMVGFCVGLSPLMSYASQKVGVLGAAVLHGSVNAAAGTSLLMLQGGSSTMSGPAGVGAILTLVLGNVALAFADVDADDSKEKTN